MRVLSAQLVFIGDVWSGREPAGRCRVERSAISFHGAEAGAMRSPQDTSRALAGSGGLGLPQSEARLHGIEFPMKKFLGVEVGTCWGWGQNCR